MNETEKMYSVIPFTDEAIDLEKSDLKAYKESYDEKYLAFLEDQLPTKYWLKRLTKSECVRILGNQFATQYDWFQSSLVKIENYKKDGKVIKEATGDWHFEEKLGLDPLFTIKKIDKELNIPAATILEIGTIAMAQGFLESGDEQKSPLPRLMKRFAL